MEGGWHHGKARSGNAVSGRVRVYVSFFPMRLPPRITASSIRRIREGIRVGDLPF